MKILQVFNSLLIAASIFIAPSAAGQSYSDVYGSYNYRSNLKVADTTFLKRLVTGDGVFDSSALAQFNSTCKGILVPRLTSGQKDSIGNPANGLLVYDITAGCFFYYNDSAWVGLGPCGSEWASSGGNVIMDDSTQKIGIGTATPDAQFTVVGSFNSVQGKSHILNNDATYSNNFTGAAYDDPAKGYATLGIDTSTAGQPEITAKASSSDKDYSGYVKTTNTQVTIGNKSPKSPAHQQIEVDTNGIHFIGRDTMTDVLTDWESLDSFGNSYFIAVITNGGKVGLGSSNPTADLQVGDYGTPKIFRYVDGNQDKGKVLTSDINGNATWQIPADNNWGLNGNADTKSWGDYIGTSDSSGLSFKTANTTFGYIDSMQRFSFNTQIDSDIYSVMTTTNAAGIGLNGIFIGNQSAGAGLYEIDGRRFGLSKHMVLLGDTGDTHVIVEDSLMVLQSSKYIYVQSQSSVQLGGHDGVGLSGQRVTMFNGQADQYVDSIADSSNVNGELTVGGSEIGGNNLSGGMSMGTNVILGDGATMTGNNLVGHGVINGLYSGMSENFITGNSHIDSNYIEGAVLLWNLGGGASNSSWSNNYLKSLSTEVSLQDVSGQHNEYIVNDTITGDNSGISEITLLGQDSIAYNKLTGPNSAMRDLLMQNSTINHCNFAIPNAGIIASQFYNSNITGVNNQIYSSEFFNVSKDFSTDSTPWNNIMLINDNVGIGLISKPTATFQLGDTSNSRSFKYVDGNQGYGKVLTSDAYGNATWQSSAGGAGGWNLSGNSGTLPAMDYIGTSDYNGLTFKTNNVAFGSVDPQQHFNFKTVMDSDSYGLQTTNNIFGTGANGIFAGNETANFGYYEIDGTALGLDGPMVLAGSPSGTHFSATDSALGMQASGTITLNGHQSIELNSGSSSLMVNNQEISENAPFIAAFNPTILPDSVADSSTVNSNIVLGGATYGMNTLSGGAMITENLLSDAGSSCIGNNLVGRGVIGGWTSGIASNELHVASHLDSNYLEGAAFMQDLGKHSHSSNFSHNYLKNLSTVVQIYGVSGESVENVVGDTILGNNAAIFNLTLMSFDSVAYNVLSGANANINNLIMQNSDLNYCHFLTPDKGFSFSQLFNSRIVNDTVNVMNCLFHNVNKDFGSETQEWVNIMLLNDNVGIGITSKPSASLQIGDSTNHQTFKYVDGNEGTGKVLTCDASGNATWQMRGLIVDSTTYFTPAGSDTVVAVAPYKYNIIDSTGALGGLIITLPGSPVEGEWIEVKLAQSGVSLQYQNGTVANSAPTYIPPQNLYIKLVFRAANNTWY